MQNLASLDVESNISAAGEGIHMYISYVYSQPCSYCIKLGAVAIKIVIK